MKSLPIHLNRLDKALQAQGVVFKRHQILEVCAAAFGYRNSNECSAAAKKGDLNPPQAPATGRFRLDGGKGLILLRDPVANAPFAVDETFLDRQDGDSGSLFGISPYGHLLDLTSSLTDELQKLAEAVGFIDPGREIELTIHTASIDNRHGISTYTALSKEALEADLEGWCDQYWNEVAHHFPEGTKFAGAELIEKYFEAHDQEFLSYDQTTLHILPGDILAAIAKIPTKPNSTRTAPRPTDTPRNEVIESWADHPIYGAEDWRFEVANGDTRQSYAEWVASKLENGDESAEASDGGPATGHDTNLRDGVTLPIYLTNGTCEHAHGDEALFDKLGLRWSEDDDDDFYPLTNSEKRYIDEDGPVLPNGYWPNMAYSFLYKRKKFAGAIIEVNFGGSGRSDPELTRDAALREVTSYVEHIKPRIEGLGGYVFIVEDDGPKGECHSIEILVPFDHVIKHFEDFDEWKGVIARLLMPADGPRIIARFFPEIEHNGHRHTVVAPGPTTWDVTAEIISISKADALAIADRDFTSDVYALSKYAPKWIREWNGPYGLVALEEEIRAYFDAVDKL